MDFYISSDGNTMLNLPVKPVICWSSTLVFPHDFFHGSFGRETNPDEVFIVTGATPGVGKALAQILYSNNAKVYLGEQKP